MHRIVVLAPGAVVALLVLYLGFSDGGAFPGATGTAAIVALLALAARVLLAQRPFEGLSRWNAVAGGALILLAGWTLLSQRWSGAPLRAMIEFDRTLLYAAVFALLAFTPRSVEGLRWLLRLVMAATGAVVVAALVTRLWPGTFPIADNELAAGRLGWPITHFNTLGTMAGLACILGAHHAADATGPRIDRVLGAALVPVATAALLMTFSRGALAATVVGLLVYLVVARPPGILTAVVAIAPGTAWTAVTVLQLDALTGESWPTAAGEADRLALVLAASVVLSGALRLLLSPLDPRLLQLVVPRGARIAAGAVAAVAVAGTFAALAVTGAPDWVEEGVDRFTAKQNPAETQAARFTTLGNNGRLKMWRGALRSFQDQPLHGTGAGTFRLEWNQHRGNTPERNEAHSVYFETLGELGLVGGALLATLMLTLAAGVLWRARASYSTQAGVGAGLLTLWSAQAAVDWLWETPAVTVPVVAATAALLATVRRPRDAGASAGRGTAPIARAAIVAALFGLAVLPARVALSQARTDEAYRFVAKGDCVRGSAAAADALRVLRRPESRLLTAFCALQAGNARGALVDLRTAARQDPKNWVYPFAVGIVEAGTGPNPNASMQRAVELNPSAEVVTLAADALNSTQSVARRRAIAERLPFPLDGN